MKDITKHGNMQLNDDELTFGPCLLKKKHWLLADFLLLKKNDLQVLCRHISSMEGNAAQKRLIQLQKEITRIDYILAGF